MASAVTAPAGLAINALQLLQKAAASLVAAAKRHKSLRTRAETFAEELNNSTTWVEATDAKLSGLPEQERLRDFLLTAEKRIQGLLKQSESSSLWRKMQAVILWAVLDASSAEDLLKELGDELGRRKKDVTHAVADFDKMPMKAFSHHNVPLKFGPENHPLPSKEGISRLYNMLVRQEKKGVVVQVTEGACEIETVGYFAALAEFTRHKNACNVGLPLWEDAKAIVDYYQSAWVCWTQAKDKTEEKLLEDIRSQLGDRQTGVSADISKSMVLGVLNRIQIKHRVLILARDVSDGAMLNMLAELIRGQSQVQLVATTRDLSTLGPSHGFPTAVLEDKGNPSPADPLEEEWKALEQDVYFLQELSDRMGDRYPEAIILDGQDLALESRVFTNIREKVSKFWKRWYFDNEHLAPQWEERAKMCRLLVEPLDIVNWYSKDKHLGTEGQVVHYVNDLLDEFGERRKPRCKWWHWIQLQEAQLKGRAEVQSSLGKGRKLKEALGSKTWDDWVLQTQRTSRPVPAATALRRDGPESGGTPDIDGLPLRHNQSSSGDVDGPRWKDGRWAYDVFISHAGEDKRFAFRLRDEFERVGLRAFVDQADLFGGDSADDAMLTACREAPVGLALLSADSLQKEWPVEELKLIVAESTLLPVLYNMSYEDAKKALETSPQAGGVGPDQWREFVRTVTRTTAEKNPSTGSDELPFVQLIVFAAVRLCVKLSPLVEKHSSNPAFALAFVQRLEKASFAISKEFKKIAQEKANLAKQWHWKMHFRAEELENR